jgi:hypothetical protein
MTTAATFNDDGGHFLMTTAGTFPNRYGVSRVELERRHGVDLAALNSRFVRRRGTP